VAKEVAGDGAWSTEFLQAASAASRLLHPLPGMRLSRVCPSLPGELPDPDHIDRILGKLARVWCLMPNWQLAWLIANLVSPAAEVSDAEVERELDRLLGLPLG
jgi:hypothetical protein